MVCVLTRAGSGARSDRYVLCRGEGGGGWGRCVVTAAALWYLFVSLFINTIGSS